MGSTEPQAEVGARTVRLPRPRSAPGGTAGQQGPRPPGASKVVVVGLDEVGLSVAVRAAELGHHVVALETDRRRVQALRVRRSYVAEIADARLRALGDDMFAVTGDEALLADFDVAVIALPASAVHGQEVGSIEAAATAVARFLLPGALVLLEPATRAAPVVGLVTRILEERSRLTAGIDFRLGVGVPS